MTFAATAAATAAAAAAAAAVADNFVCVLYCPCTNGCSHTDVYIISID